MTTITERLRSSLELSERINPWGYLWRAWVLRPFKRPGCWAGRHKHWERESLLYALGSGRSRRCGVCNRLVLKRQFR